MKICMRTLFLVMMFMALTVFPGGAAVTVGEQAPEFQAVDSNGREQSLSAYKDKFIILEWMNHECPFVKKHYGSGNMQKLQKKYTEKGAVWISICSSEPAGQG